MCCAMFVCATRLLLRMLRLATAGDGKGLVEWLFPYTSRQAQYNRAHDVERFVKNVGVVWVSFGSVMELEDEIVLYQVERFMACCDGGGVL